MHWSETVNVTGISGAEKHGVREAKPSRRTLPEEERGGVKENSTKNFACNKQYAWGHAAISQALNAGCAQQKIRATC